MPLPRWERHRRATPTRRRGGAVAVETNRPGRAPPPSTGATASTRLPAGRVSVPVCLPYRSPTGARPISHTAGERTPFLARHVGGLHGRSGRSTRGRRLRYRCPRPPTGYRRMLLGPWAPGRRSEPRSLLDAEFAVGRTEFSHPHPAHQIQSQRGRPAATMSPPSRASDPRRVIGSSIGRR